MIRLNYLLMTLAVSLLSVTALAAKDVTVKGKVVDDTGLPLIAVTVYQDGNTSVGTITDADGNYMITVPDNAVIVFSCLGYEEIKESVNGRETIDVTMGEASLSIEASEVVSVGYGSVATSILGLPFL